MCCDISPRDARGRLCAKSAYATTGEVEPMATRKWKLEDAQTVTLTIEANPPIQIRLTATEVDEILNGLGTLRASMKPEVSERRPKSATNGVKNPVWYAQPEIMRGDTILQIRDPRFGWLAYLIPRQNAAKLGQLMSAQAATPALRPSGTMLS